MRPLFKDAIDFTRSLGYRYLWVDSLCIIQDSHDDWVNESANMGNNFKFLSLTLAAEHLRTQALGCKITRCLDVIQLRVLYFGVI
jgi:Heterokaryon incompatibility protein (HET)